MSKSQRETRMLRLAEKYYVIGYHYRLTFAGFYKREVQAYLDRNDMEGALKALLNLAAYVIRWEIRTGKRG